MPLDSKPEKQKAFDEHRRIEKWLFVEELKNLLAKLKPDDWLQVNQVGNLVVYREGHDGPFASIDFAQNTIEHYENTK